MDRIKIDLLAWESAPMPIFTDNVDLDVCEKQLYAVMVSHYGYSDNEIDDYMNNRGEETKRENFQDLLCVEEEDIILDNGGLYYEDMTDEEYAKVVEKRDAKKIVDTIKQLGECVDETRDALGHLTYIVRCRKADGKSSFIDDEEIKIEDLEVFAEYLEKIRKFALYV